MRLPFVSAQLPLSLATFGHPDANREIWLEGVHVAYFLQRSQRRSIGFTVNKGALAVRAPNRLPLVDIETAVQQKTRWIVQKLQQTQAREQQLQSVATAHWTWGQSVPYLGESLCLVRIDEVCVPAKTRQSVQAERDVATRVLRLALPASVEPALLQRTVQLWFKQQAHRYFAERLDFFAPQLGVKYKSLALSNARTRWGSATARGAIRLNWRLMHLEACIVDYVVVHELSHLRHMNHSAQFWATVHSVLPEATLLRSRLRQAIIPGG